MRARATSEGSLDPSASSPAPEQPFRQDSNQLRDARSIRGSGTSEKVNLGTEPQTQASCQSTRQKLGVDRCEGGCWTVLGSLLRTLSSSGRLSGREELPCLRCGSLPWALAGSIQSARGWPRNRWQAVSTKTCVSTGHCLPGLHLAPATWCTLPEACRSRLCPCCRSSTLRTVAVGLMFRSFQMHSPTQRIRIADPSTLDSMQTPSP